MGNLTLNFSLFEFCCPCCGDVFLDTRLVWSLQRLRDLAGKPIRVTSGFRCRNRNHAVGGTTQSLHCLGRAADIVISGMSVQEMARLAEQVPAFRAGGIGIYPKEGFIHVDVREKRARWARLNGEYVSVSESNEP